MSYKRTWHGIGMDATAVPDILDENRQVVELTARLSLEGATPVHQCGRELKIIITRPTLEILARLAEDVGAVYYVDMTGPEW